MKTKPAESLARSSRLFKAFADPVRLRLLNLLVGRRELCVCHLHAALDLLQPTVSRHLAYLRKAGVVLSRKDGLWVYYRLADPADELHRTLLQCVESSLVAPAVFARDRKRLGELAPLDDQRNCC
jgi:ArsR family transcriptional regulator